jgi:hypothetical protein
MSDVRRGAVISQQRRYLPEQRQRRSRLAGKPVRQLVRVCRRCSSRTIADASDWLCLSVGVVWPHHAARFRPTRPPSSPACRPLDRRWSDRTEQACGFIRPDPAYRSTQRAWFDGRKYEPGGATSNPPSDRASAWGRVPSELRLSATAIPPEIPCALRCPTLGRRFLCTRPPRHPVRAAAPDLP